MSLSGDFNQTQEVYDTLLSLLSSKGAADPQLVNAIDQNIDRGVASSAQNTQLNQNRTGASDALVQALLSASSASGSQLKTDTRSKMMSDEEKRRRQDMMLFKDLFIEPYLSRYGTAVQSVISANEAEQIDTRADSAFMSSLLGGAGDYAGGSGGGGGGGGGQVYGGGEKSIYDWD